MATEAQIQANRRNALRSTGPRTPEGKARSSRNHLLHGLTATGLLDHESPALLAAIHEDFHRDFQPQTSVEEVLVERMALAYFRLGRFSPVEADLLQREEAEPTHAELRQKYGDTPSYDRHARQYGRITKSYLANQKTLHRLSLYEARLQRDFDRALRDLQRLQRERPPASPPPAPAVTAPEPPPPVPIRSPRTPASAPSDPNSAADPRLLHQAAGLLAVLASCSIVRTVWSQRRVLANRVLSFERNRPFAPSSRLMMGS